MSDPRPSAPRVAKAPDTPSSGGSLPYDVEWAAARRLGSLALVVAVVSTVMFLLEVLGGIPSVLGRGIRTALMVTGVTLALGIHLAVTRGKVAPPAALRMGVGFQVAQGFLSALSFHGVALLAGSHVLGWTPVAMWTMVYPLIVPSPTRRVVRASLATASMDPLALAILVAAGAPEPPPAMLARTFFSTVLACVLVPVAGRIVYGLAVEVKRAREMGSYRLAEKLGQGGMGEVWRAEHRMLARAAAIKLIRPAALGSGSHASEMIKRFEREAQATAALRSPHTIEVYDYGVAEDGTFHYVMELLEGYSLQALVQRFGPLPPARVASFLRQACHSLAEAHASGLVHRDVKPANLFVCRLGLDVDFVKVLDFGLVKMQGPQAGAREHLTVEGAFTGTPGFMAPEIALGVDPVDGRSDLYALGCVAYWLLTGRLVFEGGSPMQSVLDHVRTPPEPPSARTSQPIPAGLERLVMQCLEKDPARRPASAAALARAIDALGLDAGWTDGMAREWWALHPAAPSPGRPAEPHASRYPTLSVTTRGADVGRLATLG
jgi:serine/threonine-protein kinase